MQRRHFELIAETIRHELEHVACGEDQREAVKGVAEAFAARLSRENSRFDRTRFLKACGLKD